MWLVVFLGACALSLSVVEDGKSGPAQPAVSLYVYPLPRSKGHRFCVRACAQTTATAEPDCNTSSSNSVAWRRWSRVLAPQRVNPALCCGGQDVSHSSSNTADTTRSGIVMPFLLIILTTKRSLHFRTDWWKEYLVAICVRLLNAMLVFIPQ